MRWRLLVESRERWPKATAAQVAFVSRFWLSTNNQNIKFVVICLNSDVNELRSVLSITWILDLLVCIASLRLASCQAFQEDLR